MLHLGRADDRSGNAGLAQHPRQRHLRGLVSGRFRDLDHGFDHLPVARVIVEPARELVRARAGGRLLVGGRRPGAGEQAARERRPRDEPDALLGGRAGSSRAPPRGKRGCSGSASRRIAPSRSGRRSRAPARTATRRPSSRRCSAPCPAAPVGRARPASLPTACTDRSGGSGRGRWCRRRAGAGSPRSPGRCACARARACSGRCSSRRAPWSRAPPLPCARTS